jgi:DNA-binding NarL/FixJ family response regulator
MAKHIIIADNHIEVCNQIKIELEKAYQLAKIRIANDGHQVIQLHEIEPADVIIMDIAMPEIDGLQTCSYIKKKFKNVKIILTSSEKNAIFLLTMMIHGANGFVQKNCNHEGYYEAIECVIAGEPYFSKEVKELYFEKFPQEAKSLIVNKEVSFTKQELIYLRLIAQGKSTSEIAVQLNIEPSTVATHRKNIYIKLNINSLTELISFAIKNGY